MPAPKRINKTKEQIALEMAQKEQVKKEREQARRMFTILEGQDTIYDMQTACNALAGYIKYEVQVKNSQLKLNDLLIDLTNEKDSKIKQAMEMLKAEFQTEGALDLASLLERFGKQLAMFGANEFLKKPTSEIKVDDLIA